MAFPCFPERYRLDVAAGHVEGMGNAIIIGHYHVAGNLPVIIRYVLGGGNGLIIDTGGLASYLVLNNVRKEVQKWKLFTHQKL